MAQSPYGMAIVQADDFPARSEMFLYRRDGLLCAFLMVACFLLAYPFVEETLLSWLAPIIGSRFTARSWVLTSLLTSALPFRKQKAI